MAWEDPVDDASSPLWPDAPTLRGFPVPGEPPLTGMLE